jgi:lipopolysaccharide transport system ATP-binding protein
MSKPIIQVRNLSKKYRIGRAEKKADTLIGSMLKGIKSPLENFRQIRDLTRLDGDREDIMWALRDISFDVNEGEVLGIIGHNGAGKSTLLKILSQITEPSIGEVTLRGRVAALLEVGTGFHPELTGRENIYMNGTILGMRKKEIDQKLTEIVDFSGVEKYIDTPVKFYSSGMRVRLGFSVAAHLEPQILIIDEVLAVGDAEFQKRCLGKMETVANTGRTVLFVSHNMTAVEQLCKTTMLLKEGRVNKIGLSSEVIRSYLKGHQAESSSYERFPDIDKDNYIYKILLVDKNGDSASKVSISDSFVLKIYYKNKRLNAKLNLSISVFSDKGDYVLSSPSFTDEVWYQRKHPAGIYEAVCAFPANLFNEGTYIFTFLLVESGQVVDELKEVVKIDFFDDGVNRGNYYGYWGGIVRPKLIWHVQDLLED